VDQRTDHNKHRMLDEYLRNLICVAIF